jgi:hypothetical protein
MVARGLQDLHGNNAPSFPAEREPDCQRPLVTKEEGLRPQTDAVPLTLSLRHYGFTHIPLRGLGRVPGGHMHWPDAGSITFGGGQRTHWPFAVGLVPCGHTQRPSEFMIFGGGQRMH